MLLDDVFDFRDKPDCKESTKGVYSFNFYLSIGFAAADHEEAITVEQMGWEREEWDALSETERQAQLDENINDWASNYLEMSWRAVR